MITKVQIDGYKSFRNFELEFKPLMVIFGPNASGKSNLLDALKLISGVATAKDLKEAFEHHRGTPRESLTAGASDKDNPDSFKTMTFCAEVELGKDVCDTTERKILELRSGLDKDNPIPGKSKITEKNLRYSFKLEVMEPSSQTRLIDESLSALSKSYPHKRKARNPFLEKVGDRIRIRMEGQSHPADKDLGMDYSLVSSNPYLPHHPHIGAFREEAERWRFYYLEPKKLMREDVPIKKIDFIGEQGRDLAGFLFTLKNSKERSFDSLKKQVHLILPDIQEIDVQLKEEEGLVKLLVKESLGTFSSTLVSEGTMRVIAMLAISQSLKPASLIGYEEPENGVHPERIKIIADIFKNMAKYNGVQIIINSHSPEFVSHFTDEQLYVSEKENGVTRINPFQSLPLFRQTMIKKALAGSCF
jgi:predicted ATPase